MLGLEPVFCLPADAVCDTVPECVLLPHAFVGLGEEVTLLTFSHWKVMRTWIAATVIVVYALSWSFPHHLQLELAVSRGRHKQNRNGDGPSGAGSGNSATSTTSSKTRPAHTKVLRAKDASYSEGILQDFRREEIPAELAKFYDMQGETPNQEGWAWVGIFLPER
jgi:hypothetical protein